MDWLDVKYSKKGNYNKMKFLRTAFWQKYGFNFLPLIQVTNSLTISRTHDFPNFSLIVCFLFLGNVICNIKGCFKIRILCWGKIQLLVEFFNIIFIKMIIHVVMCYFQVEHAKHSHSPVAKQFALKFLAAFLSHYVWQHQEATWITLSFYMGRWREVYFPNKARPKNVKTDVQRS